MILKLLSLKQSTAIEILFELPLLFPLSVIQLLVYCLLSSYAIDYIFSLIHLREES